MGRMPTTYATRTPAVNLRYQPSYTNGRTVVGRPVNGEFKINEVSSTGTVANGGQIFNCLAGITRGNDSVGNFLGGKIYPAGLDVSYTWIHADVTNFVRVIIFQWYGTGNPAPSEVIIGVPPHLSAISWVNKDNIRVLSDNRLVLTEQGAPATITRIYIKGKKMDQIDMAIGNSQINKGGLYIYLVSDSAAPLHPTAVIFSRLTFND